MGIEMGRVSGPLLAENLLRNGDDLAFETSLLYLNVNSNKIGINSDSPSHELFSKTSIGTTNLIVDTQATVGNFIVNTDKIQHLLGNIYIQPNQSLGPEIHTPNLSTSKLRIRVGEIIENVTDSTGIDLSPIGTGKVHLTTDLLDIFGNLHSNKNITANGNIIFGSNADDNVTFNSDITSNVIPDLHDTYDIGSISATWKTLYSDNIVSGSITTTDFNTSLDLLLTAGHTLYVSVSGNDSNYGNHAHSTFRTIKHALSVAQSGDEIVIYPGVYTEIFPLTVPNGVSIRGTSIRAVVVKPTEETKSKDAFLLNGDTTVSYLTVQDYFYDSANDTGYAFRFAPNFKTIIRSPYLQNVTVITKGSVISPTDPHGFDQGDAGAGVLIDGSVADPTGTLPPTMLFFAVTLIVPNQDGITAKNGVRVEWLNSFTYFAKRGIYLTNGILGFASQGVTFGAEMRSINSANVYGTYGAVADGSSTIGYLIGHNFGYIGSGGDSQNDYGLVIQANEIVATNNAKLYYDSMDHKGDYRVGDIFLVNQDTGQVTFNAQSINVSASGNITLEGPSGVTVIDAHEVKTGNIRIRQNNIDSMQGPVNFSAASSSTFLNTNVFATNTLNVSLALTVDSDTYLGNTSLDLIVVAPKLTDTVPQSSLYTIGTPNKVWKNAHLTTLTVDNTSQITNNTFTTLTTNTDLQLVAAGTGRLYVPLTDVEIDNNLTINSPISILNLGINGNIILTGDVIQTGNRLITGYGVLENITTHVGTMQFGDVYIENNIFTTTVTDTDLELSANGTGRIYIPYKNVKIDNDLTVSIDSSFTTTNVTNTTTANQFFTGDILIDDNVIITSITDQNLVLKAATTGKIYVPSNNVLITNDLTVDAGITVTSGVTSILDTQIVGSTLVTGNINQTGDVDITGTFANNNISVIGSNSFFDIPNINILHNIVSVTSADSDLILSANGTGGVILDEYLKITNSTINNNRVGATTDAQKSIKFSPNGTGNVVINSTKSISLPIGNNSSRVLSTTGEIRYNSSSNIVEGWQPSGYVNFANLWDSDRNTYITAELTPGAADNLLRFSINGTVTSTISETALSNNSLLIDNVKIFGNTLRNNIDSINLNIEPTSGLVNFKNSIHIKDSTIETVSAGPLTISSTGIGYVKFAGTNGIVVPHGGPDGRRLTPEVGEARYNTDTGDLEIFDGYNWVLSVGSGGFATPAEVEDIMNVWSFILG